jgi:hypothetical protein
VCEIQFWSGIGARVLDDLLWAISIAVVSSCLADDLGRKERAVLLQEMFTVYRPRFWSSSLTLAPAKEIN